MGESSSSNNFRGLEQAQSSNDISKRYCLNELIMEAVMQYQAHNKIEIRRHYDVLNPILQRQNNSSRRRSNHQSVTNNNDFLADRVIIELKDLVIQGKTLIFIKINDVLRSE